MSERYSRLFALPEDLYSIGSPVVIAAGALLKDNQTGKVIAQLKLRSISEKAIKAVKVKLNLFDTAGNPIGESLEHSYLDLNAARNSEFGQKSPVAVPEAKARSYQVSVSEVVFVDQSVWTAKEGTWEPLTKPVELSIADPELLKQYQVHYGSGAKYEAKAEKDLWNCTCGALNHEGENCHICGHSLFELQTVDMEKLTAEKDARLAEIARKAAEEQAAAEAQKKKTTKILAVVIPAVCAVVAIILLATKVIIPNSKYNNAVKLMDSGNYGEAIVAFEAMAGYKDSIQKIEDCELAILEEQYSEAVALMEAGQYKEAIAAFEAMDGYKESTSQIEACKIAILDGRYADAIALMEAGQYEEAIAAFEALNDYKNSNIKIQECNTAIQDEMYNNAVTLLETGKYAEAYEMFAGLSDYKNSAQLASQAYNHYFTETYKDVKVGDHIFFGAYEQDNITSNGKEEIEWIVLEVTNGRALLISNYVLDVQQYEDDYGTMADYYWQRCSLRKWLGDTFLNNAFSIDEKAKIPFVTVPVVKQPTWQGTDGKETQDQVFLLSHDDLDRYFDSDGALQCSPTKYAKALDSLSKDPCDWWIRTHTDADTSCAVVMGKNIVNDWTAQSDEGVRPAIWIDLNA